VVDDGSTDATANLVQGLAAGQPLLTLLSAGPLPPGWPGKVHALWVGSQGIETPWLLLTDADTRHAPGLLARAHAAAAERRLDMVSVAGHQEVRGAGENLLIPAVFALLDAMLGDWEAVAAGGGPAVANGQLILLRREAWESTGGFEPIRHAPIDDVAIASQMRAHGFRTGFFRSGDLRVRMYRGWADTFRGWRRNLGALFAHQAGKTATLLAILLLPPLVLLASLLGGFWAAAAVLWAAGATASMLLRAGSGHAPGWGLLYPLDAVLIAGVLFLGVLDRRRGKAVRWKEREVKV
jgi:chlorobactene glucosyltransferase